MAHGAATARSTMRAIIPGVVHWRTHHPRIGEHVSSYWLRDRGVLIDPRLPDGAGLAAFRDQPPTDVLLTIRHHYRHSGELAEAFGCEVWCNRRGLYEFTHGERVRGFDPGDELPGGVVAREMAGISTDDTALHVPWARAIAFGDSLVKRDGGELSFMPDHMLGTPEEAARARPKMLESLSELAKLDVEHLLLAHQVPVVGNARRELEQFLERGGRQVY